MPVVASLERAAHPVEVMRQVCHALWLEMIPTMLLTVLTLVGVSMLLVLGQTLGGAVAIPAGVGLLALCLGSLPVALSMALPVGALVGAVSAGRSWMESGAFWGLLLSGTSPRVLLWPVALLGVVLGLGQGLVDHELAPRGRSMVRHTLHTAAGDLILRPGQPLQMGHMLLHAEGVESGEYHGLFVASEQVVLQANVGAVAESGGLMLRDGAMMGLVPSQSWTLSFSDARLALDVPTPRVELSERSWTSLRDLIARTEASGRSAAYERLVLYKRTALPLSLPILLGLGVVLGLRGNRPGVTAVGVLLAWWTAVRLCDQGVGSMGPLMAVLIPPGGLLMACAVAWRTVR